MKNLEELDKFIGMPNTPETRALITENLREMLPSGIGYSFTGGDPYPVSVGVKSQWVWCDDDEIEESKPTPMFKY